MIACNAKTVWDIWEKLGGSVAFDVMLIYFVCRYLIKNPLQLHWLDHFSIIVGGLIA